MKHNVILITADQMRGDCVGNMSDFHPIMTPHLNQLACEGTAFSNCYADCPICMPQRVSLLTGKTGSNFGNPGNFEDRSPINVAESLPTILKKYGNYQTKAIGKTHLSPERSRFGFEHMTLHPNDYTMFLEEHGCVGGYRGHGLGGNELFPTKFPFDEKFYHTNWIIDQGVKYLYQLDEDNPFFMWMVFEAPHNPFDPPAPYDKMYDNFTIPNPVVGEWEENSMPTMYEAKSQAMKFSQVSPEINKEIRRKYYGQITNIDYQLGKLFGELKSRGLYDDSLIIFTSDHGELLGDHKMYGKTSFLRGSGDVPLLVKFPKGYQNDKFAGEVSEMPVLTVDIFSTILEVAGIEYNSETPIDGESLVKLLNGEIKRETIYGEYGDGYGSSFAFDGRYKYIYFVQNGQELMFDDVEDIKENHDISKDPKYAEIKEKLKSGLIDYLGKYKRPMVENGELVKREVVLDSKKLRTQNMLALRAGMHFADGYGGLANGGK